MRRILSVLVLATCGMIPATARASITYQYVTDQTNYNASAAGGTVTVQLFLQEQLTGSSTSIINNEGGLFGAGIFVQQATGAPASPTTITSIAANTRDPNTGTPPGFGTGGTTSVQPNTATQAGFLTNIGNTAPNGPSATNVSSVDGNALASTVTNSVLLGTLTLKAGAAGTVTSYNVESYKNFTGFDGNTLTLLGTDLDVSNNNGDTFTGADNFINTFTVTVAAVPEPSGLWLSGLVVPVAGIGAWLRWRQRAVVMA